MITKVETLVYVLLIFLLPTQLGKHFWPSFSFIGGLRVDYLSPTIYTTDLLILILVILTIYKMVLAKRKKPDLRRIAKYKNPLIVITLFLVSVCAGVFFAKNQLVSLYGLFKLLEMLFFGWYTARNIGNVFLLRGVCYALLASVLFQASLAITQFVSKGSLNGIFYFFGERTFTMITPGIANASIGGQLVLRPYGTLPHPNVLAGFLLLSIIFLTAQWQLLRGNVRWGVSATLLLGSAALFLTLSRTTLVLCLILLIVSFFLFIKKRKTRIVGGVVGILGGIGAFVTIGPLLWGRFMSTSFLEESFVVRADLFKNAWWMFVTHPLIGVGLMNFLVWLPSYQQTHTFYLHLQPVHNIFALIAAEVGIVGSVFILWFFFTTIRHVSTAQQSSLRIACFLLLASIFFLGLFDHYFITLQQGQLLFAFILGCCWSLDHRKRKKGQRKN